MLTQLAKRSVRRAIRVAGYDLRVAPPTSNGSEEGTQDPLRHVHSDMEEPFPDLFLRCAPFTMTSTERLYALFQAIQHIETQNIPGAVVECGVWRGGSSMMAALTLIHRRNTTRSLYLYDTYSGMSVPTEFDEKFDGSVDASEKFQSTTQGDTTDWCYAPIDEVTNNLASTEYPMENIRFIKGKVEESLPKSPPDEPIAILRLDTDFYESTKCELELLYPKLVPGGILIIDDYGTWMGAHKAVEDYFEGTGNRPLLHKIDRTGRMAQKL